LLASKKDTGFDRALAFNFIPEIELYFYILRFDRFDPALTSFDFL
jgi:hypothetical protein